MPTVLEKFSDHYREVVTLQSIGSVLHWDRETYMPSGASDSRATQSEYLSRLHHSRLTDPKFLDYVDSLYEDLESLNPFDRVNVREIKRKVDQQRKLSEDFVGKMTRARSLCTSAWIKARPANDFQSLIELLDTNFDLQRQKADLLGFEKHPYDALLDEYEPGLTQAQIHPLLVNLGEGLRGIIPALSEKFRNVKNPSGHYPVAQQLAFNEHIMRCAGYDFERGRLDLSAHPFSTTLGVNDHRITTRCREDDYLNSLTSTLHEMGHAFYELGFVKEQLGFPMGHCISMGIHESLSRLWENVVGRSREFSEFLFPAVCKYFPQEKDRSSADTLWSQLNKVEPSLIRIDSDEVTYSLHIVIRMLIEEQIARGDVKAADLPALWNELYEHYLGISIPEDKDGVMQDVHWFWGMVGYFPTYALGNIFNGMFRQSIVRDIPDVFEQFSKGEFSSLLNWLNTNIHEHGMRYGSFELIEKLTGKAVSSDGFLEYIREKHGI